MNRRQRALLTESILVLMATVVAVVGLVHLKDYINRSEAMRAMGQLGGRVLEYRKQYGSLPPESFVDSIKGGLEGAVRLGNVKYRARYIGLDAPADTILAYSLQALPHLASGRMDTWSCTWTEQWSGWRYPNSRTSSPTQNPRRAGHPQGVIGFDGSVAIRRHGERAGSDRLSPKRKAVQQLPAARPVGSSRAEWALFR